MNTLSSRINAACSAIKNVGRGIFPPGTKIETIPDPKLWKIKIVVFDLARPYLKKDREVTLEQIEGDDTKDILEFMASLPWKTGA